MSTLSLSQINNIPNPGWRDLVFSSSIFRNSQPRQYISKAKLQGCTFVIMAEAASLALASTISSRLNLAGMSDCQQLGHFINGEDLSNPPDWRIKHLTQLFYNHSSNSSSKLYKVQRRLNTIADTLA
jgi:hypothetical protein